MGVGKVGQMFFLGRPSWFYCILSWWKHFLLGLFRGDATVGCWASLNNHIISWRIDCPMKLGQGIGSSSNLIILFIFYLWELK